MSIHNFVHSAGAAQLDQAIKQTSFLGQIAGGIHDDASYQGALAQAKSAGIDTSQYPPQYDPAVVKGFQEKAITAEQALTAAQKAREMGQKDTAETETMRHNLAEENAYKSGTPFAPLFNPKTGQGPPAAGGVMSTDPAGILTQIKAVEGTGQNPRSSASGPGQMVNATFTDMFRKTFPAQATGMSDQQILAKRGSGVEDQMLQTLTGNNIAGLTQAGMQPTAANAYAAHVLGIGGATHVLAAAPTTPLSQLVPPNVIQSNPQFAGMTVAGFQKWTTDKMTPQASGLGNTPDITSQAKKIAEYGLPAITGKGATSGAGAAIMAKVMELNPSYDGATYGQRNAASKAFNTGKQGDQVRSINVAVDHLDQVRQAATALKNGNIPLFNSLSQALAKQTGSNVPTNFAALKDFVMDEAAKAIIGGGGGVGDRDKAAGILSGAGSPDQLAGAIAKVQGLMGGQLRGLRDQYARTTGRQDFDTALISSRTRQVLGGGPAPAQAGGQAVTFRYDIKGKRTG